VSSWHNLVACNFYFKAHLITLLHKYFLGRIHWLY